MFCCDSHGCEGIVHTHSRDCRRTWPCGCAKALDPKGRVREFQHTCPQTYRHEFNEHLNSAVLLGGSDGNLRMRFFKASDTETLTRLRSFMRWDGEFWTCLVTTSNVLRARELGDSYPGPYDGPKRDTRSRAQRAYDSSNWSDWDIMDMPDDF